MTTRYCARCLTTFNDDPERCTNLSCGAARPGADWGVLLGAGDLLDRHYRIVRPLAVGGAGLCYLAREVDDAGRPVPPDLAIKVLYAQRDSGPFLRRLSNEAQILQELAHDHIVQCRGFVHRAGQAPYLVTLFENGGSLAEHVERNGRLPPLVAANIIRQVLQALDVAHQRGVVHRDLKPENVLLHEAVGRDEVPRIRVADFGIAKVFGGVGDRLTRVGAFIGTPEFAAPEQFEGVSPTPATDVFAAGALLFYLLTGRPPITFKHRADIEQSHQELLAQIPPRLPAEIDPDALEIALLQEIVDATMAPEPGDRRTIVQLLARLSHVLDGAAMPPRHTIELTSEGAPARTTAPQAADPAETTWVRTHGPDEPPSAAAEAPAAAEGPFISDADLDPHESAPRHGGRALLGVAGAVSTMVAAAIVVVVLGIVGLIGLSWSRAAPQGVAVHAPQASQVLLDASTTDPALVAARDALQDRLARVASDAARLCSATGSARVDVRVDASGAITSASIDPGSIADERVRACVEQAIARTALPSALGRPARLRARVSLD